MEIDFSILDLLIKDDVAFAIWRLPLTGDIHMIVQKDRHLFTTDMLAPLDKESGFILSPFQFSANQPIVLIRPDLRLTGREEIEKFVREYSSDGVQACSGQLPVPISTSREEYEQIFRNFQKALSRGDFQKLVLSRILSLGRPQNFSVANAYRKALSIYPNAFVYVAHTSRTGTWLGSSPELFLAEQTGMFHTVALAGTQRIGDPLMSQEPLAWDTKNLREQAIVADYMRHQLKAKGLAYSDSETYNFRVGDLAHLKTDFYFQKNPMMQIGQVLEMIHPTPAVSGFPKQEAFQFIINTERHSRSYYSGFVGNLSMNNRTDLYVNLRCLQIFPKNLALYAGGGILTSSVQEEEWKETEDKLQAMLNLIQ
jgi:isochorismate synthase